MKWKTWHVSRLCAVVCAFFLPVIPAQGQKQCGLSEPLSVNNGAYKIGSNQFESSGQECINLKEGGFAVTESSISAQGHPGAYPFIYVGCHWGSCTSGGGLPIQVSEIESIKSDWSTTQPTSGSYDVAYDIWFDTKPATTGRPDAAEVMIWLNTRGPVAPAGKRVANAVSIGGATYSVWFKHMHHRNYVAYLAANTTISVSNFDLQAFIEDAVVRGYVHSSWYLISIEAGFELWEGGAGLATNTFSATINDGANAAALKIWWPTEGKVVSGEQPFKARLEHGPDEYSMFWSVDGGRLNAMSSESSGGEHKEAAVDLTQWTWRDAGDAYGPFEVTFIAKDSSGEVIRKKTIRIYVAKRPLARN